MTGSPYIIPLITQLVTKDINNLTHNDNDNKLFY